MSDSPTTEGSIVAKLAIDSDQASVDLKSFKAQVDALDASHPEIKVSAETGEATAKIEELKAAEAELNAETDASTSAFKKYVPELNAVSSASDHAAQSEKSSAGYLASVAAVIAVLLPLMAPLAAEGVAVGASLIGMGAGGILAIQGIKKEMADGTAEGLQYGAGIRSLKNDLDSLESTAAAQFLNSFDGLVKQVDSHLPQLNTDVGLLSGSLGQAGGSVLGAFLNGLAVMTPLVDQADKSIENMASDFDDFSSGGGLVQFVNYGVNEIPIVEENFASLGVGVGDFVADLAPLANVMLGIIGAGGRVLDFFSSLGPVLPVVAGGALGAFAAFKLWGTVPAILSAVETGMTAVKAAEAAWLVTTGEQATELELFNALLMAEPGVLEAVAASEDAAAVSSDALGTALDVATGPAAILFAILGALAVGIGVAASAASTGKDAVNSYTDAVSQDNGVIGDNVKLQAAKALQDAGALKNATSLGIATKTLTDATLGDASAKAKVTAELDKQKTKLDAQIAGYHGSAAGLQALETQQEAERQKLANVSDSMDSNSSSIKAQLKAYNDLQKALGGVTITTGWQLQAQKDLAGEFDSSVSVYEGAVDANKKTQAQADQTTLSLQLENDAATLLTNTFTIMNGGTLDLAEANTGLAAASNSVVDSMKQNGKEIEGTTAAAVANQQAIQAQVTAAQQQAEAVGKATGSSTQATAAYLANRDALEAQLKAAGDLTPQMQTYIDQLYDVANLKVPPTKLDIDDADALKKLAAWNAAIKASIGSEVISLDGSIHFAGGAVARAGGGFVDGPGTTTSDSVILHASRKEFVVKASSAQRHPDFMRAYNADPDAALASIAGSGGGASHTFNIYEAANAQAVGQKVINRLTAAGAV